MAEEAARLGYTTTLEEPLEFDDTSKPTDDGKVERNPRASRGTNGLPFSASPSRLCKLTLELVLDKHSPSG